MPPSLNCSFPNFDPKCFQVLGDYNPCHDSLNDEKYIALVLLVLCFLVLLLQGLRTAKWGKRGKITLLLYNIVVIFGFDCGTNLLLTFGKFSFSLR